MENQKINFPIIGVRFVLFSVQVESMALPEKTLIWSEIKSKRRKKKIRLKCFTFTLTCQRLETKNKDGFKCSILITYRFFQLHDGPWNK